MRNLSNILILLILSLFVLSGCGAAKDQSVSKQSNSDSDKTTDDNGILEKIKKRGVLIVASSNDAPFAFIDKDTKEFTGIDADIIKEIAKRLDIPKVEMKEVKFENLLLELMNKSVDMVTDGMFPKPERRKIVNFTDIWYQEGEALVVLKDSTITGLDDLNGKVVGAQKGTAFFEFAQKLQNEGRFNDLKIFGSQAELLLAVNTQKIDAAIVDNMVSAYSIKKDPTLSIKIVSPYKAEVVGEVAAAVRKEDNDLLEAVNREYKKLKEEGFVLEMLKKYGLNEDSLVQ